MRMKEFFGRFGTCLLVGLLLVQVSMFHVYEHHDVLDSTDNPCEICVLTIEGQQFEGILPAPFSIDFSPPIVSYRPTIISFGQNFTHSILEGTLFSRPPPFLII